MNLTHAARAAAAALVILTAAAAHAQDHDATVYKVVLRPDDPVLGPRHALVTLVEYIDMQCPYCAKAQPSLRELDTAYAGKLRRVFKHQPLSFHPNAMPAAIALEAAREQGRLFELADRIFADQANITPENLKFWAREVGCNGEAFDAAFDGQRGRSRVEADMASGRLVSATGTPTFFINGRKLGGARPVEQFRAVIDEELRKAEALVEAGTRLEDLYGLIVANGKTVTPPEPVSEEVYSLDVGGSPVLGPAKAPVTVVVFSEFECTFCARAMPTLRKLVKHLPGKVKLVFKHYPLSNECNPDLKRPMHPGACIAARWGVAAQAQGKFWAYSDAVFENLPDLRAASRDDLQAAEALVAKLAKGAGVDVKAARAFIAAGKATEQIDKDIALARTAKVRGTPSIFLNGHAFQGNLTLDGFEAAIKGLRDGK